MRLYIGNSITNPDHYEVSTRNNWKGLYGGFPMSSAWAAIPRKWVDEMMGKKIPRGEWFEVDMTITKHDIK